MRNYFGTNDSHRIGVEDISGDAYVGLFVTICFILSVTLIFLSMVTLTVVLKDYTMRNTPSTIFIANLAAVDLGLACFTISSVILALLFPAYQRVKGLCALLNGFYFSLCALSLLFTFTNSTDRYLYIKESMKYYSIMTQSRAKKITIFIWSFSMCFGFAPPIIATAQGDIHCKSSFVQSNILRCMGLIPLVATYALIGLVICMMYLSLFRVIKRSEKRHSSMTNEIKLSSPNKIEKHYGAAKYSESHDKCQSKSNISERFPSSTYPNIHLVKFSKPQNLTKNSHITNVNEAPYSLQDNSLSISQTVLQNSQDNSHPLSQNSATMYDKCLDTLSTTEEYNMSANIKDTIQDISLTVLQNTATTNEKSTDNNNLAVLQNTTSINDRTLENNPTVLQNTTGMIGKMRNISRTDSQESTIRRDMPFSIKRELIDTGLTVSTTDRDRISDAFCNVMCQPKVYRDDSEVLYDSKVQPLSQSFSMSSKSFDLNTNDDLLHFRTNNFCLELNSSISKRVSNQLRRKCFYNRGDLRTSRLLFFLLGVYVLLWSPSYIIMVMNALGNSIHEYYTMASYLIAMVNSVIDFFVYSMRVKKIQRTVQRTIRKWCTCEEN